MKLANDCSRRVAYFEENGKVRTFLESIMSIHLQ